MAESKKNRTTSSQGFGNLRSTFHTIKLIDSILHAGETANDLSANSRLGSDLSRAIHGNFMESDFTGLQTEGKFFL
jgi:hypothetical protein